MSRYDLSAICDASGLPPEEAELLRDLVRTWREKRQRNELRERYYRMRNALKDLGISIPPPLRGVETVVGWPAKAVDALAARSRFDGFTWKGDGSPLEDVLAANRFGSVYCQAVASELVHSCAFLTVSRGGDGEPAAIVSAYSATAAAALWNDRVKRIDCGMTVVDVERKPGQAARPRWVNLYTSTDVWEIERDGERWAARRHPHAMGRPMMEPLVYRPSLDRPFGKSRVSRAVMSITDSAVRCALRTEVASEFFTAPQKYLLGADDDIFDGKERWEAYIGAIMAISRDENGDVPQFGQLAQSSMQPHIDYMRSLAARFSGETGIPISELGVVHDNPTSAESIYAAKEPLVIEAENLNMTNGYALREIGLMALAASRNAALSELTDEERTLTPRFRNPAMPSIVTQSDAMVKMVSALPWMADSDVTLEELGFSDDQRQRLSSDRRRSQSRAIVNDARTQAQAAMLARQQQAQAQPGSAAAGTSQRQQPVRQPQRGADAG